MGGVRTDCWLLFNLALYRRRAFYTRLKTSSEGNKGRRVPWISRDNHSLCLAIPASDGIVHRDYYEKNYGLSGVEIATTLKNLII